MPSNTTPPDDIAALWDRYRSRLLAFIRARVSNVADAEDLLQEVFVRVHNNLCCLPPPQKTDSWLYTIARNLVTDHYRKQRVQVELPQNLQADSPRENREAELALSLREMIDRLPEDSRQALILTEYEGLSQKQLSERLGISFSGAKSRVQRAREKLRAMILACCHLEFDRYGRVVDYQDRCCCCNH